MTQEDKELLLKDLCGRLLHGVKVHVNQDKLQEYDNSWNNWNFNEEPQRIDMVGIYGVTFECMDISDGVIGFEYIKPYLFPMSSMTEEQEEEVKVYLNSLEAQILGIRGKSIYLIDWLNANHFDYRGLIGKGLAIDCTDLNIY